MVEFLPPYMVDYHALSPDFQAVQIAEQEIGAALSEQLATRMIDIPGGVDANANAQRRIGNFLGAASAFRDRSKTRLIREFGKESTEEAAFQGAMKRWFDAGFAYRCLYQLRNFAQHHELPISFVPINAERGEDGAMTARVRLELYPPTPAASPLVNKAVRTELATLPATPLDLSALAAEYMRAHDGLMATLLGSYAGRMTDMAHYQAELYTVFEIPHDVVPFAWEGDDPARRPQSQPHAFMMGFDENLRAFTLRDELVRRAAPPA